MTHGRALLIRWIWNSSTCTAPQQSSGQARAGSEWNRTHAMKRVLILRFFALEALCNLLKSDQAWIESPGMRSDQWSKSATMTTQRESSEIETFRNVGLHFPLWITAGGLRLSLEALKGGTRHHLAVGGWVVPVQLNVGRFRLENSVTRSAQSCCHKLDDRSVRRTMILILQFISLEWSFSESKNERKLPSLMMTTIEESKAKSRSKWPSREDFHSTFEFSSSSDLQQISDDSRSLSIAS